MKINNFKIRIIEQISENKFAIARQIFPQLRKVALKPGHAFVLLRKAALKSGHAFVLLRKAALRSGHAFGLLRKVALESGHAFGLLRRVALESGHASGLLRKAALEYWHTFRLLFSCALKLGQAFVGIKRVNVYLWLQKRMIVEADYVRYINIDKEIIDNINKIKNGKQRRVDYLSK